jgi:hypothetical protein
MSVDAQRRSELAIWLVVDLAVAVACWIGRGPAASLVAGTVALIVTVAVHVGRARVDAARIASGVGDERVRSLYVHANSVTATVLWAVITPWWLVGVARGEHNATLLVLVIVQAVTFLAASVYFALRS